MKERLEKEGHVIILDLANGGDFIGVEKGCWAVLNSAAICDCVEKINFRRLPPLIINRIKLSEAFDSAFCI